MFTYKETIRTAEKMMGVQFPTEREARAFIMAEMFPFMLRRRDSVGFDVLVEEEMWYRSGRPTIVVKDNDIAKLAYNANFDIDYDSITPPQGGIVQFAFEKPLEIEGFKVPGALFGRINLTERFALVKHLGAVYGNAELERQRGDIEEGFICIFCPLGSGQPHLRAFLDPEMIKSAIESPEWFLDHPSHPGGDDGVGIDPEGPIRLLSLWDMTKEEAKHQAVMLRLFCGMCAYMKAFPESYSVLREGKIYKQMFSPRHPANEKKVFSVGILKEHVYRGHGSLRAHWRSWHFRTLRHERYKRNPDGTCRVVLVRGTMVHGE